MMVEEMIKGLSKVTFGAEETIFGEPVLIENIWIEFIHNGVSYSGFVTRREMYALYEIASQGELKIKCSVPIIEYANS